MTSASSKASVREKLGILIGQLLIMSYIYLSILHCNVKPTAYA